ncbi:MAG TPA: adenylate/guanylate cyclase domain-containing protein [Baekduia sp.]|nr:adenylate/guanylate cyclase domain-containing protein [Baekduia sp.]
MSVRIVRTFAFLDLCGFTAHMDDRGDDVAAETLARLRTSVRRATERHGVRVAKWLGDGSMLVAVESASLLDCLDDIWADVPSRLQLPLRGGMAAGEVLIFEGDDYVGHAVNLAARLCAIAQPGQVLATDGCDPDGGPVRPLHVRGVAAPVRVRQLHDLRHSVAS